MSVPSWNFCVLSLQKCLLEMKSVVVIGMEMTCILNSSNGYKSSSGSSSNKMFFGSSLVGFQGSPRIFSSLCCSHKVSSRVLTWQIQLLTCHSIMKKFLVVVTWVISSMYRA